MTPSLVSREKFHLLPQLTAPQGQATDIAIQAEEIMKLKKQLYNIYAKHTKQSLQVIGEHPASHSTHWYISIGLKQAFPTGQSEPHYCNVVTLTWTVRAALWSLWAMEDGQQNSCPTNALCLKPCGCGRAPA